MSCVCRLCSASDFDKIQVTDIFGSEGIKNKLPSKINELANVSVAEDDPLPNYVCMQCISKMDMVLAFQEQCRQSQASLWKEYISTYCGRASRLRKDVRVGTHYKHADALVQRAVSEGVDLKNLRECLQQAVGDLYSKTPNMLKQLAVEPVVPLERCREPTASSAADEIEEALPVFCITRAAVVHRNSSASDDGYNQVLTQLCDKASTTPISCRSVNNRDKELGRYVHSKRRSDTKRDNTKANNKTAGICDKEMALAGDENAINFDKEMLEAGGKQTSDNHKRNTAVGLGNVIVDEAQGGKEDGSCESPGSDDADCTKNKLEITEFVDVGIFNDEVVKVNNEVKIKEEEEPLLEFTEPVAVFHERAVGEVFKPLKKTTKHHRVRACPSSRKKHSRQPLVDAKPIKLEPATPNNLLELVLLSNSKSKYDANPTIRRNALVQLLESNSTASQPAAVVRAEIVREVPQSSQIVAYSHAACQTTEECPKAEAHQQTNKWPSIEVPVSRAKSVHYVFDNNLQPPQAIAAAHLSCSIRPPAPPTHGFANGRQLPVSRVQPLTTNMRGSSQENLHESQNFEGMSLGAQPMSPNQISTSLLRGPRPVAQSYSVKRQLNDGVRNVVQYSRAADVTTSVVGMQQSAANVDAVLSTQHPATSIQQVINNSHPTISVVNRSSLVNVLPVPSNQQPATSLQHVISNPQPTISVVNHSLLSNVRGVPSIQHPTTNFQHFVSNSQPTISVVNHSSTANARLASSIHHPTTSFQHISNSQPAISVVNHSSPANVRPVLSIHHPITNFQHVISNSQPAISVGNHSSPLNVRSVPSIHHSTTSFQQVISNPQPTISVVKHLSLANVRAVPSIQNPTATSYQSLINNAQPEMLVANHSSPANVQEVPGIQQPIISFQHVNSTSQPSISVVNPSSLTNVRTVPGIQQPTTSFQHTVSNSQPSISVVNPSSLTNVRTVSDIQQSTTSFQHYVSNSQPSISVVNPSSLNIIKRVFDIQQPTKSFQHNVSNSQPSISVVNPSTLTNVRTVSGIQQPITSFQHTVSNSQPSISVVNPSSLTNVRTVSGIQQPITSFQHHVSNSQPVISVVNHSLLTNVPAVPSSQQPTTSFQHVNSNSHSVVSSQPIISVKNFSRMNVDPISQNSFSDNTKQPAVENTPHYTQPASAKRSSDTVVNYQSVGMQAKLPKLLKKQSATSESQAHATRVAHWTDSLAEEPTIQSFSMSLKDWDNLKDDSNTSHVDTFLSGQEGDSTNQPVDGLSDQFAGTAPCEDSKEVAEHISPEEVKLYKEYLKERNRRYVCGFCEGYLDTEMKCLSHIKDHMKDSHFYCRVCNSEVPASRYIKNHLHRCALKSAAKESPGSKYRCIMCRIEFYNKVSLQYHFRRHAVLQHDKYSYLCHPCGKAFVLRPDYIAHKLQVHGIFEGLNKPPCHLTCGRCGMKFFTMHALAEHRAKHCRKSVDGECLIID